MYISGGQPCGLDAKSLMRHRTRIFNESSEWSNHFENPSQQLVADSLDTGPLVLNLAKAIDHPFNFLATERFTTSFVKYLEFCNLKSKFPTQLLSQNVISDVFKDRFIMLKLRFTRALTRVPYTPEKAEAKRALTRRARVRTIFMTSSLRI